MTAGAIRVQSTAQVQPTIKGSTIFTQPTINNWSTNFAPVLAGWAFVTTFGLDWFPYSSGSVISAAASRMGRRLMS
jgi:hypothetical protein